MSTAPRPAEWRTSSFSSNGSNCVEVLHDLAAVRDSKNPGGPELRINVRDLVATVKS